MMKTRMYFLWVFSIFLIGLYVALTTLNFRFFNTVQVPHRHLCKDITTPITDSVNHRYNDSTITERTLRDKEWRFVEKLMQKERRSKRLPDIIGIGVKKCGTHALIQLLAHHPMIRSKDPYEASYFERRYVSPAQKQEYIQSMPETEDNAFIMEKTPAYFTYPHNIPSRIKSTSEFSKLLLIMCDPAKRVISDYVQEIILGSIKKEDYPTVESYLEVYLKKYRKFTNWRDEKEMKSHQDELFKLHYTDYPSTILTAGLYALHLPRWFEHYNSSNLHIINGDEMLQNPGRVIEKVQDFLGIPKLLLEEDYILNPETQTYCFLHPLTKKKSCIGSYKMRTRNGKMKVDEKTLESLREFYRVPNELLYKLLNVRFYG